VLYTDAGNELATGYTPMPFTNVTAGTSYELLLDSYAACTFEYWQGTSNSGELSFTATNGSLTFIGVYNCTNTGAPAYHSITGSLSPPLPAFAIGFIAGLSLLAEKSRTRRAGIRTFEIVKGVVDAWDLSVEPTQSQLTASRVRAR